MAGDGATEIAQFVFYAVRNLGASEERQLGFCWRSLQECTLSDALAPRMGAERPASPEFRYSTMSGSSVLALARISFASERYAASRGESSGSPN